MSGRDVGRRSAGGDPSADDGRGGRGWDSCRPAAWPAKLRERPDVVRQLRDYRRQVESIPRWGIQVLPVDLGRCLRAADVRAAHGLLTNDSIIVATMRDAGVTAIATADRDFERVEGIAGVSADRSRCGRRRLLPRGRLVWYFQSSLSGNNSVVECDLAKVEVAGSNPVSRSNFSFRSVAAPGGATPRETRHWRVSTRFDRRVPLGQIDSGASLGRRSQVVRQRSAKPPSPVQIRTAPPQYPSNSEARDQRAPASTSGPASVTRPRQGMSIGTCRW